MSSLPPGVVFASPAADPAGATVLPPETIAAYLDTDYRVQHAGAAVGGRVGATADASALVLRVGTPNPAADALLARHGATGAAFLTAWNPRGETQSAEANAAAQAELAALLQERGLVAFDGAGEGRDGRWPAEPSLLVLGLTPATAVELGRAFGQNAYVFHAAGGSTQLVLLR